MSAAEMRAARMCAAAVGTAGWSAGQCRSARKNHDQGQSNRQRLHDQFLFPGGARSRKKQGERDDVSRGGFVISNYTRLIEFITPKSVKFCNNVLQRGGEKPSRSTQSALILIPAFEVLMPLLALPA